MSLLYDGLKQILGIGLEVYFVDIQATGRANVPAEQPIILAANHPNSIMDTMVLGSQTNRKISYMAKSSLFKNPIVAWVFDQCGVIPIYKTPGKGGSNDDAFRRAFDVLDAHGTIGIFPEGRNSNERELFEIKTGTARIALGAGARSEFKLPVRIVPVGLNFQNRDRFLSSVLVKFGTPIEVESFYDEYQSEPRDAVRRLTDRIQTDIQNLSTHIAGDNRLELVRAANEVYGQRVLESIIERKQLALDGGGSSFDDLRDGEMDDEFMEDAFTESSGRGLKSWIFDEIKQTKHQRRDLEERLMIEGRIADALEYFEDTRPEVIDEAKIKLWRYQDHLKQVRLRHDFIARDPSTLSFRREAFRFTTFMLIGAIPAAWGFMCNAFPYILTWMFASRAPEEAQRAIRAFGIGIVVYPFFYSLPLIALWFAGAAWWAIILYAISMPIAGFFFLRYRRQLLKYRGRILTRTLFQTERHLVERVREERDELIDFLDTLRAEFLAAEEAGQVKPRIGEEE